MNQTLNISLEDKTENYQIVKFEGDFDKAGYSDIKDSLKATVDAFKGKYLIFDFSKLKFINSEGIGYLMELNGHLVKGDKKLAILKANAHVKDVFSAIGLPEIMPVCDTIEACLK
ncbi:hypothetical protein COU74_03405 [Candidatus Peregrinibacteria bacterium CG10_big_fil_rev_8_21_14_0_10_36_19]|nr:MAG: hypothetical protein COU74_03405 [Candidatus Peregrinibacteria bacterium CG10_big_fil_rev_8_21_14_0_10_36_19]